MKTGRLKTKTHCPRCNKTLDGWSHEGNAKPKKGDVTVCVYCSAVLQFTKKLRLKHASAKAIAEIDFLELQRAHGFAKRWHPPHK